MLQPQQALDQLRRITFKIRIEKNIAGAWDWGTGFFISKDGCALTAFHNLPAAVVQAGSGTVDAFYKGQWIKLQCLVAESLPEHEGDIALLKWQQPSNILEFCPVATLEQKGMGERFVDGIVRTVQPLKEVDQRDLQGAGPNITGTIEWLCFFAEDARQLRGISGASILDLKQVGLWLWNIAICRDSKSFTRRKLLA